MFFNEECFIRFWSKDEAKTQMQKFRRALLINTTNQKQTKQLHEGKHSNNADKKNTRIKQTKVTEPWLVQLSGLY